MLEKGDAMEEEYHGLYVNLTDSQIDSLNNLEEAFNQCFDNNVKVSDIIDTADCEIRKIKRSYLLSKQDDSVDQKSKIGFKI